MRKLIVEGYLVEDAKTLVIGSHEALVFTIANKEQGQMEWFRCFASPSVNSEHLRKGNRILVDGTISFQRTEKEGKQFLNMNVSVHSVNVLSIRKPQDWSIEFPKGYPTNPE